MKLKYLIDSKPVKNKISGSLKAKVKDVVVEAVRREVKEQAAKIMKKKSFMDVLKVILIIIGSLVVVGAVAYAVYRFILKKDEDDLDSVFEDDEDDEDEEECEEVSEEELSEEEIEEAVAVMDKLETLRDTYLEKIKTAYHKLFPHGDGNDAAEEAVEEAAEEESAEVAAEAVEEAVEESLEAAMDAAVEAVEAKEETAE